jgi:Pectate lyase, N terminus
LFKLKYPERMAVPNCSSILFLICSLFYIMSAGVTTAEISDEDYWKQREETSHARNLAAYDPEPEAATNHFNRAVHE